jgi:FtsH-binding integral membrane protein
MVGALVPQYDKETVMMSAVCTMAMFIALTLYACFTKTDMTKFGGFLCSCSMMVVVFILMYSLFFRSKVLNMLICCVVVALLSVFIVYDT